MRSEEKVMSNLLDYFMDKSKQDLDIEIVITNKLENVEGTSISHMKLTTSGYVAKGLGMENASWSLSTAFCAGTVNFR